MSDIAFKSYDVQLKEVSSNGDTGIVEAIVSVFGNVDSVGDITQQGAFAKTLQEWQLKGDPIPFIFSHQWDNPAAYLGAIVDAKEVPEGLYVKAQLDLSDPEVARVHRLLKQRLITQFSFGYIARDWEMKSDPEQGDVRLLKDVQLLEAGPTLLGANTSTRLIQAASAQGAAESKAIEVPSYIRSNARKGLAYYEDGYAGDGLRPKTVREAKEMAAGSISEDKVKRMAAWLARHKSDLDAPQNSNPDDPEYPGAGLVAWLLWGGDADGGDRAQKWADKQVATINAEAASNEPDAKSSDADEVLETQADPAVVYLLSRHQEDRDSEGIIGTSGNAPALTEGTESPDKE